MSDLKEYGGYASPDNLEALGKVMMPIKRQSHVAMQLKTGSVALDVGCGPGIDTVLLGEIVGPTGKVLGIDFDQEMIVAADKQVEKAGVSGWVKHQHGDATHLPFENKHFDACRSERVFQHLFDPKQALAELWRVTKPGGWIVVVETDWSTLTIDAAETEILQKYLRIIVEDMHNSPYVARHLYALFRQQGLVDITLEGYVTPNTDYGLANWMLGFDEIDEYALENGKLTKGELQRLRSGFEEASARDEFYGSINMVMIAGRKPQ